MEGGKRVQTVQDWVAISEKWQKLLASSVAPHVCKFFLDIYHACQSHAVANARPATVPVCVDHFLRAVNAIDWNDFTEHVDKIIEAVPELSTAFKTYFVAEAWVLTSVRLQTAQGVWNPSFQVTLPTKRKILIEIMDNASTAFLARPNLITKPEKVICHEVEETVGPALLRLVRRSDFMESFIRAMKAEHNFAPLPTEPLLGRPHVSAQPPRRKHEGDQEDEDVEVVAFVDSDTDTEGGDQSGRPDEIERALKSADDKVVGYFDVKEFDEPHGSVSHLSGELVENPITGDIEERIEEAQLAAVNQDVAAAGRGGPFAITSNPPSGSFPEELGSIHEAPAPAMQVEGSFHEDESAPAAVQKDDYQSVIDTIPF